MSVKLFFPEYREYYYTFKKCTKLVKISLKTNLPKFPASDLCQLFDIKDELEKDIEYFDFDDLIYFAEIYPEHKEEIVRFMEFIISESGISSIYYNEVIDYLKDIG